MAAAGLGSVAKALQAWGSQCNIKNHV